MVGIYVLAERCQLYYVENSVAFGRFIMKKRIQKVCMVILGLCFALSFSGCGIIRDAARRDLVEKVLQERYGEEFIVKDTWTNRGTSFMALAYPKRDTSLLFEGLYKLQEGEPPYVYDHYDQAIIAQQLKEVVQPELEALFGDCYIQAEMMGNSSEITNVEDITIENYATTAENPSIFIKIGVNSDQYSSTNYQKEYESIINSMAKINQQKIEVTVYTYFLPTTHYQQFVKYFLNNISSDYQFKKIVNEYSSVGIAVINGKSRQSYEEYLLEREDKTK